MPQHTALPDDDKQQPGIEQNQLDTTPNRKKVRAARWMLGIGVFFLFGAIGGLLQLLSGNSIEDVAGMPVAFLIGIILTGAGIYKLRVAKNGHAAFRRNSMDDRAERAKARAKAILRLAEAEQGRITVARAILYTEMTIDDAQETLETLCKEGLAYSELMEEGGVVYVFPGLQQDENSR